MAHILIVEDNPANLELMRFLLEALGRHTTISARDGEAGLASALKESPDLVICDIQMPGLDGFGLLERLRALDALRTTPCVAVTALAMPDDRARALAAGFNGYITKPIEPESFVSQVESYLLRDGAAWTSHQGRH